jgi:hypothetical protein
MICNETIGKWCKNKHGASKNYRYVGDVSRTERQRKKRDYRSHTTTRRTPSRARSEKIMGTTVRPKETYRRRREDPGDIGDKNNKKVE